MKKQIEEIVASLMEIVDEIDLLFNNMVQKQQDLENRVVKLEEGVNKNEEHKENDR